MAKEKKRKKNKVLKIVRRNHVWITLLFCLIVAVIADGFIIFFSSSFATYVVDSKIVDEYDAISYLAKIYDKDGSTEGENIYALLNEDGRTYFITDKDGNIIYQYGTNTMGTTNGTISLPVISSEKGDENIVRIYLDNATEGFFEPDENGDISINPAKMIQFAIKVQNDSNIQLDITKSSIDLPLWVAIDVKDGKQVFYGKASFIISISDVIFVISFVIAGIVLVICIIALMLANMISSVVSQKKMTTVYFTDPITRGHNWMWFSFRGEQLLKRRRSASVNYAVVDLVFVKYRNYCVCHSVAEGEEMLYRVDKILRANVNKRKELAVHYASANFALLLRYNNKDELEKRIKDIISKLEQIDSCHKFSFHAGVYEVAQERNAKGKIKKRKDINIEREYNNACTARSTLVECDESGVSFFEKELVDEQIWIDTVMEKHEAAIANEEFVVYYQPKYDPQTDELRGVEALIRWDSPELGFINPGRFIPIFENNGIIPKIDHYMITHVARDQKRWLDEGYECVPASVNVSRAHFIEKDLAVQIRDAVDKEGAPHELIEIELTESAFFDDKKAMIDTIRQLKEFGFKVSMDDFGSGYSSLNSLKDMPLDVLKLDAEFFAGDVNDDRGEIVVSEAIQLAKRLNMLTVAEGVEAKEQVAFLAKHGCDMIQGYIYEKPMSKDNYETKMNRKTSATENSEASKESQETVTEEKSETATEPATEKNESDNDTQE